MLRKESRLKTPSQEHSADALSTAIAFFNIPTKIRLRIYEQHVHLPPYDEAVHVGLARRISAPTSLLTILLTCRLMLVEAETIFCALNRLRLDTDQDLFLFTLCPRRLNAVAALELSAWSARQLLRSLQLLQCVPKLTSLHLFLL